MAQQDETSQDAGQKRLRKPPGRRPLSEGDAAQTREAIRRHAIRLFNERGYAAVSMEDILEATSLTRGTLYYHFKGKSDIFVASMLALAEVIHQATEAIVNQHELSVEQRLRMLVHAHASHGKREEHPEAQENAFREFEFSEKMVEEAMVHLSPQQQAEIWRAMEGTHRLTQQLLAEGVERGELRKLPHLLLDFALWQLFFQSGAHLETEEYHGEERADYLLSLFFEGVRAR